jgi:nitroreductase
MHSSALLEVFNWRHACKEFDVTRKINEPELATLLKTISLSPSSFGLQPYEVFVVQNAKVISELKPVMWGAQKQLETASHTLMFAVKKDIRTSDPYFNHMLVEIQQTPENMRELRTSIIHKHQVEQIASDHDPRYLTEWGARQAYLALGNLMTSAAMLGIDSCPIEGFEKSAVTAVLTQQQVLDPNQYEVAVFCCLGYRQADPVRPKARKPLSELVHFID